MLTSIVGINWGDEGKGRMVDLFSEKQHAVVRYQGGSNGTHTVINEHGKFVLSLLPSGILHPDVICIMGNGMCINPEVLEKEIRMLKDKGVDISPRNLKISDRATITMPYHVAIDNYEEERLGPDRLKCVKRGNTFVFADKYLKKAIRMGDLLNPDYLASRLHTIVDFKSLEMEGIYHKEPLSYDEIYAWSSHFGEIFHDYICDTGRLLSGMAADGKDILFEAQLGALRDIDFGIYPFTSSASTTSAYAPIGAGIPSLKLDKTIGVMKAFSSCIGAGPFVSEMSGPEAENLREVGEEYENQGGLPYRVGAFDAVASRYGVQVQGADEIALTKLDALSYLDQIPICVAYNIDGRITTEFPVGADLEKAKPVMEYVKGWKTDIAECRNPDDLPVNALTYIKYLEQLIGARISYASVGPERKEYIAF